MASRDKESVFVNILIAIGAFFAVAVMGLFAAVAFVAIMLRIFAVPILVVLAIIVVFFYLL